MNISNVEFIIEPKQITFFTQVDGDKITITDINFTASPAAAIAYLINQPKSLKVEIKIVED